jgi:two-component system CheB/CheR fusion protein
VTVTLKQENDQARLDVRDTGIGIAPESLGKLFTMFSQVSLKHDGRRQQGLGIGLALVAQLAEAHGGRVAAASAGEGQGSTFTVWLPLVKEQEALIPDSATTSLGMLHGLRILLVDDSQEILDMLSTLCEIEGAQVWTAASGSVALQLLAQQDFDVLVSDIGMPVMDGYSLLARLRKSGRNANIPAVALSGYGQSDKARAVGFDDQLCKPVPINDLLRTLNTLIHGTAGSGGQDGKPG